MPAARSPDGPMQAVQCLDYPFSPQSRRPLHLPPVVRSRDKSIHIYSERRFFRAGNLLQSVSVTCADWNTLARSEDRAVARRQLGLLNSPMATRIRRGGDRGRDRQIAQL